MNVCTQGSPHPLKISKIFVSKAFQIHTSWQIGLWWYETRQFAHNWRHFANKSEAAKRSSDSTLNMSGWSLCKYRGFLPFLKQWLKPIWLADTLINHGTMWWPSIRTTAISAPSYPILWCDPFLFVMITSFWTETPRKFDLNYNPYLFAVFPTGFMSTLNFYFFPSCF